MFIDWSLTIWTGINMRDFYMKSIWAPVWKISPLFPFMSSPVRVWIPSGWWCQEKPNQLSRKWCQKRKRQRGRVLSSMFLSKLAEFPRASRCLHSQFDIVWHNPSFDYLSEYPLIYFRLTHFKFTLLEDRFLTTTYV